MAMRLSEIKHLLKKPCRSGNGYSALCPCHDDKRRSLSVWENANGEIRVQCHAGCDFRQVKELLGIVNNGNGTMPKKEPIATHDYTDEEGRLHFQTLRYFPKNFKQRQPDGNGGWIWNLQGVQRVLYRLPEIKDAEFLYFVEGEKDVESLRSLGETATCSPMGAGKWRPEFADSLRGKVVALIPDNDEPGRKHMEQVARDLLGVAKDVLLLELPNLPGKGDVTDFLEGGGSLGHIQDLVARAESWKPNGESIPNQVMRTDGFNFTPIDVLLREPEETTSFIWENTLPAGGFSICSAKPKVGKSTLARSLAVAVSRGEEFLNRGTVKGKVLYLCLEEKRTEIAKHFRAMAADGENIYVHTEGTPKEAIEHLQIAIDEYKPALVIIDPLSRVLRVGDFNDYGGMARGLEPLIDISRKLNCHILALHHDSKADRSGGDAMLGSTALFGAVDCHIQLKKRDKGRTISTTQRYGIDIPETVIDLDRETGWVSDQGDLESFTLKQVKGSILEAVKENEELEEKQIKERVTGFNQGAISKALRELMEEDLVSRNGLGKRGNPYLYSKATIQGI